MFVRPFSLSVRLTFTYVVAVTAASAGTPRVLYVYSVGKQADDDDDKERRRKKEFLTSFHQAIDPEIRDIYFSYASERGIRLRLYCMQ